MSPFPAYRIVNDSGTVRGALVEASLDDLSPGDVLIRAAYSSVNYKDALAATGAGKIVRRFPIVGGIDVSGTVESSGDPRFAPGDRVLVTGYDLGVAHDGGYAAYVRVPGDWVVPVPDGLSLFDAMALGTAGFTAALAVCGSSARACGRTRGRWPSPAPRAAWAASPWRRFPAWATLSRPSAARTISTDLRGLGAAAIVSRTTLDLGTRPLEKATWAGAVDAVGGDMLSWLVRTTNYWGSVASTGLTGGVDVRLTVMPFILRGVSLIGVDSVMCPMELRRETWRRLATDMKPRALESIATVISLDGLDRGV